MTEVEVQKMSSRKCPHASCIIDFDFRFSRARTKKIRYVQGRWVYVLTGVFIGGDPGLY